MEILLVEDDFDVAHAVTDALETAGHAVVHVTDDSEGLTLASSGSFDVIILDRILGSEGDGLKLLKRLRFGGEMTPVLLISGLGSVQDRIDGLRAGANDYLSKPVALMELVARVEALTFPKKTDAVPIVLRGGDIHIDLLNRIVTRAGRRIDLQPREYKLLEYLMRRPGEVVTRKELLEVVWKTRFDPGTSVIEVHLSRLRKKIDSPFGQSTLHTIRNVGFMFQPADRVARASEKPKASIAAAQVHTGTCSAG
jgi:two-component system OmpR family response regulator